MTALQPDDFVRHARKPDWGTGRVVVVTGGVVEVRFENEREVKRFPTDRASTFLEQVSDSEVSETTRAATLAVRAKPATSVAPVVGRCRVCSTKLNRSRYSVDGRWKSCPKCSATNGVEHVLRPQPDAFGTTTERVTSDNPDGIQSYCVDCRHEAEASMRGADVRLCSEFLTQAKQP